MVWRAGGEPVLAGDIDAILGAVPDDQNAALLYERAMGQMVLTTPDGTEPRHFTDDPTLFDSRVAAADALMQANQRTLQLVRQARRRPQVAWSHRLGHRIANPMNLGLGREQRSLARLLRFAMSYRLRQEDHRDAVATLHDAVLFADAVDEHPTLISSFVAWAIHRLEYTIIEERGAGLAIAAAGDKATDEGTLASRGQVQDLILALLDEATPRRALEFTWLGERAYSLAMRESAENQIKAFGGGRSFRPFARVNDWIWDPAYGLDELQTAGQHSLLVRATAAPTWPDAEGMLSVLLTERSPIQRLARPFSDIGPATQVHAVRLFYSHLALRRMAATALAIRLFEIDHGRRPSTLSELVPDYLPAVPVDPLDPDAGAIRYKLRSNDPVLYSVWRDGKDNGGVQAVGPDGRLDWNASDLLFHLDGEPVDE